MGWADVLAVLVLLTSTHAQDPQLDNNMFVEPDSIELPETAIDDSIAGSPGSAIENEGLGLAHQTSQGIAEAPCEMEGNGGEEEEVVVPLATPIPIHIIGVNHTEFVCRLTTSWVEVLPTIRNPFNVNRAEYRGNDRLGYAHESEMDVTNCSCICSGANRDCGQPGSRSFYANIVTKQQCAQMMCHKNKFSACLWGDVVVGEGFSVMNAARFNSSVLDPINGPLPPENLTNIFRRLAQPDPSATPSPSPSSSPPLIPSETPSPSPSPSPSTLFEDLVRLKVVSLIAYLKTRTCVMANNSLVPAILSDLKETSFEPIAVMCPQQDPAPPVQQTAPEILSAKSIPVIANALAGYSENSPLFDDETKSATQGMNFNDLLQLEPGVSKNANAVEKASFRLIVRLFQDSVPTAVQCGLGVPGMDVLVNFGFEHRRSCVYGLDSPAANSSRAMYSHIVSRLIKEWFAPPVVVQPPPPVNITGHRNATNHRNVTRTVPSPSPSPEAQRDPPVFPPLPPGPDDVGPPSDPTSMEGTPSIDCVESYSHEDELDEMANVVENEAGDDGVPGALPHRVIPNIGRDDMPQFGAQSWKWEPRESSETVVLDQPPQFDDAEELASPNAMMEVEM